MQIPEQFQQKMVRSFGERGSAWLAHLPHIYERAVRKWSLTNCSLSPEIFYNLICFGDSPDFGPVVLKIGMPHRELFTEIQALRLYGGRHICACHDADPELGALLLERVVPGTDLTHVASHRERSLVGAGLMARLPVPLAEGHGFPAYSALLQEAFRWVRAENRAGVAMLALVETAEALFREVEEEGGPAVLLHGDLHHKNILRDRQGGWRAIDPKGIAGVAVMETARFIQNELDLVAPDEVPAALDHMTSLFAAELGQPKRMVALCAFVDKVLSTVWGIEENYTEAQLAACMSQCDLFLEHVRQL